MRGDRLLAYPRNMASHLEGAVRFLRKREEERQARLDRRFEQAWRDARAVIAMLIDRYRPLHIYQWGSLLDRSRFWERSDIDIAVEGIVTPEGFFALYGDAERLASLRLDLVAIENIEPEFAELIRTKGQLVYEREGQDPNPAG